MTESYKAQIKAAKKLLADKGPDALYNPHVLVGQQCRCRDCFCCAAVLVHWEHKNNLTNKPA